MFGLAKKPPSRLKAPDASWCKANAEAHTLDIAVLEQYEWQLMFICCDMMHGHRMHETLDGVSNSLAMAFTQDEFSCFKHKLGKASYPIPLRKQFDTVPFSQIQGELYMVRPYHIPFIDNHRANGVEFIRERVKVIVPFQRIITWAKERDELAKAFKINDLSTWPWKLPLETVTVKAWMYVGMGPYWDDLIDAGYMFSPVKTFSPKPRYYITNDTYYYFTPQECSV